MGAAKARMADACRSSPPAACKPISLRPAYRSPAKSGVLPFHREM